MFDVDAAGVDGVRGRGSPQRQMAMVRSLTEKAKSKILSDVGSLLESVELEEVKAARRESRSLRLAASARAVVWTRTQRNEDYKL